MRKAKVSVIPVTWAFKKNALFNSIRLDQSPHTPNTHWLDCFAAVYRMAGEFDIEIGTDDVLAVRDADIVIYTAQTKDPEEVSNLKKMHPRLKAILVWLETSLGGKYVLNPRNLRGFDAVLTYDNRLIDNQKYFALRPRAYYHDRIRNGLPFEDRRVGCMVGTNYKMRLRSGILAMRKGWHFSLSDWIDYVFCPGELGSYRRRVAEACAAYPQGTFDLYGAGWESLPETRRIYLGVPKESTLSYLGKYRYYFAFENHASDNGLISERIWDALWADTVPVYRGRSDLNKFVPAECFVDATQFETPKEMLDWLCNSSKDVWTRYRSAGREFIRSSAVEKFLPEAFAAEFLRVIQRIQSTESHHG